MKVYNANVWRPYAESVSVLKGMIGVLTALYFIWLQVKASGVESQDRWEETER